MSLDFESSSTTMYFAPKGTQHPITMKDLAKWYKAFRYSPAKGVWEHPTAADDLRGRLNDRLQGREPREPFHTEFWKGVR